MRLLEKHSPCSQCAHYTEQRKHPPHSGNCRVFRAETTPTHGTHCPFHVTDMARIIDGVKA